MISFEKAQSSPPLLAAIQEQPALKAHEIKVASIFKRIISSSLVRTVALTCAGIAASIVAWPLIVPAIGALGTYIAHERKRLAYEITLAFGYIVNKLQPQKVAVYDKISEMVYLGRIPLKNDNDHNKLVAEGIGCVISVVEKFENHELGILSDPVTPEDWKSLGIEHYQIETPDFKPLKRESYKEAIAHAESAIASGKKVYIHCKAGRGRSAAVVVALHAKKYPQRFPTAESAVSHVKACRPHISLRTKKIESIKDYLQNA